jgi:hypothetical protein
MGYIFLISWALAILIAIIYTYAAFKKRSKKMFDGLPVVWFSMILCGWVLGFVAVGVSILFWLDSSASDCNS